MAPSHVLVPLDGSPLADDALEHALETFDCRVTVLNVVTPLDATMSEGGVLDADADREAAARERAADLVEGARRRAAAADRTVETVVETALAPIAGANGGELLLAPSDQTMNRQLTVARATRTQKTTAW